MTKTNTTVAADVDVAVNGPDGVDSDWESIDWHQAEDNVRRLRQRIFSASKAGDLKRVRNLQKLMLRCRSNTLISVRQVTQRNAGRLTPGIDGKVALTPRAKYKLVVDAQRQSKPCARPLRRVYIPKANGKRRPLGIPVIFDRVQQARVKNALEPEWEARLSPRSYGFRPGRSCQDAIGSIYLTLRGHKVKRQWILDADLTAAFDKIDHTFLLDALGSFPAKKAIAGWLKAGVIENGKFAPTDEGTPQGGVISPTLLNITLHGLEEAAGVRYESRPSKETRVRRDSPVVVTYADDFVVICHSRDQAQQIKAKLTQWLAPRGLSLNEDKTNIVNLSTGFDFLGFNIRQYRQKLLIKPSKAAMRKIRKRLSDEMLSLRGGNVAAVLAKINPIVRGWSAYYRSVVSSKVFHLLDIHMWRLAFGWARHAHRKKSKSWVITRYFGRFNKSRNDNWVFGDHESGAYLLKFSWTAIVRHSLVKGASSPDDRNLARYWESRRSKQPPPPMRNSTLVSLKRQNGKCPLCRSYLLLADESPQSPREWEQWMRITSRAIGRQAIVCQQHGKPDKIAYRFVHTDCYRRHCVDGPNTVFLQDANEP